jgi:hypothetical protein
MAPNANKKDHPPSQIAAMDGEIIPLALQKFCGEVSLEQIHAFLAGG